jgi:hypothetical protein
LLFHLITNVWGARHTESFLRMTLPNVLSGGNLPALARAHAVRYRIHTTPADRARIEASPAGRRLASSVPVEIVTPLGERAPAPVHHVHWFHKTAAEAKRAGAVAVFVPPDTLWSDGTFARCGEVIARGYDAIATPFLQVVAETCIDDALARFTQASDGSIAIPPAALAELGRRHLHPLTALAMPASPHARPGLERYWPVPGDGILSRFAVRELFAFDPRRRPITFLWYAGGPEDTRGIYFSGGPHDMGMLSVDPIAKYLENTIVGHTVASADLVRSTLHPWNDTEQTRVFARRRIVWAARARPGASWRATRRESDRAMRAVAVRRVAQRLWKGLKDLGCHRAAGALALALEVTPLAERRSRRGALTVLAPSDVALGDVRFEALLAPGAEAALAAAIERHVVAGPVASSARTIAGLPVASGPHRIAGLDVFVVDACSAG